MEVPPCHWVSRFNAVLRIAGYVDRDLSCAVNESARYTSPILFVEARSCVLRINVD